MAAQDFIVDIGIIRPKDETLPAGWEIVDKTIGGHDANLNAGFAIGRKIYPCFRRGRGPSVDAEIVTGVQVICEGKDTAPFGFERVGLSIGGHSANMNQTTGGSKLFFYVERKPRSETEIGITDIKVIRPRKGEQADAGYSLLLKNLNEGSFGDEIRIAVKHKYVGKAPQSPGQQQQQRAEAPTSPKYHDGHRKLFQKEGICHGYLKDVVIVTSASQIRGQQIRKTAPLPYLPAANIWDKYAYSFDLELHVLEESSA